MDLSVFQRTIVNEDGTILPVAQIDVYKAGTLVRANLFSDKVGTTPITNPFNADGNGFAQFYTSVGTYDVKATLGAASATWDNVEIGRNRIAYTGQKNLILNPRKTIQQRATTGGLKQVIEANMNVGGDYTLSFTGTATATIYEFPALLADYATTLADVGTNTLGSGLSSGATVTPTAGYYIAIEFSVIDFNNVQLEQGSISTNLEIRHNELELCLPRYETTWDGVAGSYTHHLTTLATTGELTQVCEFKAKKRKIPIFTFEIFDATMTYLTIGISQHAVRGEYAGGSIRRYAWSADAEIFNTTATYKEDAWFI